MTAALNPAASNSAAPYLDKSHPRVWKALNAFSIELGKAVEEAGVSRETLEIMYVRISQLNGCAFCLDLHTTRALKAGASPRRVAQLAAWEDSQVFTDAERAALEIGEAATLLPAPVERRAALAAARETLGDEAFTVLEWAAISMNAYNRVSILSEHPVHDDRPADTDATAAAPATVPDQESNEEEVSMTTASNETQSGDEVKVRDVPERQRFEILVDGEPVGFSRYVDTESVDSPQRVLHHTEVDPNYGGRGLAATLTREAIAASVAAGKRVVPVCPYVQKWVAKNTEFADHIDAVRPEHLQLLG